LATINEGASILLTWLINFIKWNAGVVKYKFERNQSTSKMAIAEHQKSRGSSDEVHRSSIGHESELAYG
jgi:hypothetical protein